MSIKFSCEHCGKMIEAGDNVAGKWRKCPSCHNKLRIPDLSSDEELKLVPIDENEELRKKKLLAETFQLEQAILKVREESTETAENTTQIFEISERQLTINIITYLRQMADGKLDEAQEIETSLASRGSVAIKILDEIALSEIPEPELANIPPQILSGLIRTLRTQIS